MTVWEERITRTTDTALVVEHVVRYRFAAPLIRTSAVWVDLGCGTGLAASEALGGRVDARAVLVELDEGALAVAQRELAATETVAVPADLTSRADLTRVRAEALAGAPAGDRCLTCFEVIEHLESFVGLLELLRDLAEHERFTVLLSVPNDAFWGIENPHHRTTWSEEAFEELRRLLPPEPVLARQHPLHGSAVVPGAEHPARLGVEVEVGDSAPSQCLAAFGPRAGEVASVAAAVSTDLGRQRSWERQRASDLAYYQARIAELEQQLGEPPG
jgi:SAM-dependent methyltransferase